VPQFRERGRQILRFGTVGIICVVLNLALFGGLADRLGWNYLAVTVLAFFVVNAVGFALSRTWTFRATHDAVAPQAARYLCIQGMSLLLNLCLMWLLVRIWGVDAVIASLLISVLFAIGNFLAQKNWAFRRRRTQAFAERSPSRAPRPHPAQDAGR
jgi:putative flippase GtrA